tara:strand:+ start:791 stop:2182 length:1392 start_codon:yes stop_codon:yes gene_type:complete
MELQINISKFILGESLITKLTLPASAYSTGRISLFEATSWYVHNTDPGQLNEGFLSSVGRKALNLVASGLGKLLGFGKDVGSWLWSGLQKAGNISKDILKKIGRLAGGAAGLLNRAFFWLLEKIPGGETAFNFLLEFGQKGVEKLQEMGKEIGDQLKEWAKTAKVEMVTMLLKALKRDDDQIKGILKSMNLDEPVVEARRRELSKMGVTTLREYNLVMHSKTILSEVGLSDIAKQMSTEKIGELSDDAKEKAEMVVAIVGDPSKATDYMEDPEEFMRGAAAEGVNWIMTKVLDLMEHDFELVVDLYGDMMWAPFKSGFGQAAAAMMGVLSSPNLAWEKMVTYVQALINGFKRGTEETKKGRTVQQMFLTNKGELFKDFFTGIIKGSNLEQIVRAVSGDLKSIKKLIVSVVSAIVGSLKAAAKKHGPGLTAWLGEQLNDDDDDAMNDLVNWILEQMGQMELAEV